MKINQFKGSICRHLVLLAMGCIFAVPFRSFAQTEPLKIDPKAEQIFRQMTDFLKSAQSFSFEAEITRDEVLPSGQKLQFGAIADYAVRRPNRLQGNYNGDRRQASFYYDGTTFTFTDTDKNLYSTFKAASDIDGLVDQIQDNYGFSLPMGDLLSTTIYSTVMQKEGLGSRYVGLSKVRGVSCHHLAFTTESRDLQIWIADSQPPVPCKFIITDKEEPSAPQYTAVLFNWDFKERSPDDPRFQFQVPANAQKIDFLPSSTRPTQVETNSPTGGVTP
jgi:hypothetical protein